MFKKKGYKCHPLDSFDSPNDSEEMCSGFGQSRFFSGLDSEQNQPTVPPRTKPTIIRAAKSSENLQDMSWDAFDRSHNTSTNQSNVSVVAPRKKPPPRPAMGPGQVKRNTPIGGRSAYCKSTTDLSLVDFDPLFECSPKVKAPVSRVIRSRGMNAKPFSQDITNELSTIFNKQHSGESYDSGLSPSFGTTNSSQVGKVGMNEAHAVALYDYTSKEPGDVAFQTGDVIRLLKAVDGDWLSGYNTRTWQEGIFPKAFVDIKVPLSPPVAKPRHAESRRRFSSFVDASHDNVFNTSQSPDSAYMTSQEVSPISAVTKSPVAQLWSPGVLSSAGKVASPRARVWPPVETPSSVKTSGSPRTDETSPRPQVALKPQIKTKPVLSVKEKAALFSAAVDNSPPAPIKLKPKPRSHRAFPPLATSSPVIHPPSQETQVGRAPVAKVEPYKTETPPHTRHQEIHAPTSPKPSHVKPFKATDRALASALVLYEFPSTTVGDLALVAGETVQVTEKENPEWWCGRDQRGCSGMFPANFVRLLDSQLEMSKEPSHHVDSQSGMPEEPSHHVNNQSGMSKEPSHHMDSQSTKEISPTRGKTEDATTSGLVVALYEFKSDEPGDLCFKVGDVIKTTGAAGSEWSVGELLSSQGQFPNNFVRSATQQEVDAFNKKRPQAAALYDFDGETADDLSFKAGSTIYLLSQVNSDWLKGELVDGHRGMFPKSFVKIQIGL